MHETARLVVFATVLVMFAGCGGGKLVEYDPLKDRSTLHVRIASPRLTEQENITSTLYLYLSGEGKHPSKWDASLSLTIYGPKDMPDILGEKPKLSINPSPYSAEFESFKYPDMSKGSDYRDDTASFDVPIDKIAELVSEYGKLEINGKLIPLTADERAVIRNSIVAAREATNAGK